jgi:hypothetical protein
MLAQSAAVWAMLVAGSLGIALLNLATPAVRPCCTTSS